MRLPAATGLLVSDSRREETLGDFWPVSDKSHLSPSSVLSIRIYDCSPRVVVMNMQDLAIRTGDGLESMLRKGLTD